MGEPAVDLQKFKEMFEDIQNSLKYTTEDGKVIKITDALKMFPELQAKYADLAKRLDAMETMAKERKWADMPGVNEGKEKFSLLKAMWGIGTKDFSQAGYEKAVMEEAAKKAMGYSTDTLGGYLVPAQAIPELIEFLRAEPVCMKLGATLIPNLQGSPVLFPKQTGGSTIYWVGENVSVTPSDLAFGQVQLTPKKAMALAQISNSLIRMALVDAEAKINQDLGLQLALAVDIAALRGPGAANQPLGIANTPGINTYSMDPVNGNGAVIGNLDVFAEMEYTLAAANALRGKLGFAFNPVIKKNLKKIKVPQFSGDPGTQPLIAWLMALSDSSYMTDEALTAALGYPFATTTQIPTNLTKGTANNCTELYFGNWAEMLIGQWLGLRIMASDVAGTAFASDQTWLRIIMEVDVALRHDQSFCLCNDVKVA
ncbi:MAG: phage major capsid protein [Desulfobaccales bacterium]